MARGWESKTVEEQISSREAEAEATSKPRLTPEQSDRQSKREGLLLMISHTVSELESTRHERRRVSLQRALEHLQAQMAELEALESQSSTS
jgi:hypothetical protein